MASDAPVKTAFLIALGFVLGMLDKALAVALLALALYLLFW